MAALAAVFAVLFVLAAAACAGLLLDRKRAGARFDAERVRAEEALREAIALRERLAAHESRQGDEAKRYEELHKRFQDTFDALARRALNTNSEDFLKLAKETFAAEHEKAKGDLEARRKAVDDLLKPIGDTLKKTDEKLGHIEKTRAEAFAALNEQLRFTNEASARLRDKTDDLVNALRKPQVSGRYGEIQLERVVELAGMRGYCDFDTQASVRDDQGNLLRPDMIVRLPNDRVIAIDAKTNIEAYLDAIHAANPEDAERHLERFARHVYDQALALAKKDYWKRTDGAPEFDFVVMFIPGDQFIDAALQRQPRLLDAAMEHGVVLASPSTLVGLLRAVHVGWREKGLTDSAQELFTLGSELHERARVMLNYVSKVGGSIDQLLRNYNALVGSIDGRLVPTLRRFESSGAASGKPIDELNEIDGTPRTLRSAALPPGADDAPEASETPEINVRANGEESARDA